MVRTDARCAAATMELRLKIEEGSDMFYMRVDAKNQGMGAMHTGDVAGKVGRDDSVDRHCQSGTQTRQRQPPVFGGRRLPSSERPPPTRTTAPREARLDTKRAFSSHSNQSLWPAVARIPGEVSLARRRKGRDRAERDKNLELEGAQSTKIAFCLEPGHPPHLAGRVE